MERKPIVLFHRKYGFFSGGHLKVNDYLGHVDSADWLQSAMFIHNDSRNDHLWIGHPGIIDRYDPESADVLFVAGTDWRALHGYEGIEDRIPVINLIQGVRHANPDHELFGYLSKKATRICVSRQVADAIERTGRCNGPIYVIENGIDLTLFPERRVKKVAVVIAGLKQPQLSIALCDRLQQRSIAVDCIIDPVPRDIFLEKLGQAHIAVTLPTPAEGFFLPALEAMAMGTAVVCPDCVGNRGFCIDGVTCLMPDFTVDGLEASVLKLLDQPELIRRLQETAFQTSRLYDIRRERNRLLELLDQILFQPM